MANGETPLGFRTSVNGHVALSQTVRANALKAEELIQSLQGGVAALEAADIAYDSGNPGDSNSTATTVAGALDDIYSILNSIVAQIDSSNSGNVVI